GRLAGEALAAVRARGARSFREEALVGGSKGFRRAVEEARRVSLDDTPVLIVGDPGTGKRALAQSIHALSARALGPFVAVDCRRSADELSEELFGQLGGQGGVHQASALLRADSGTLLLRNVDALRPETAVRLVRLLEARRAPSPRGGEEAVDLRVLATSCRSLGELLIEGGLHPELVRLFPGGSLELPSLRARATDVLPLFEHFAAQVARRHFQVPPTLTPDARRLLTDYSWPRNVEELRLLTERLALLFPAQEIPSVRLPPELQQGSLERPRSLDHMLARLEREAVVEALREARGKKIRAAEILGISRPTLDKKISDYGITVQKVKGQGAG
ncbi:MAG: sigma 54-interacting transcriptional regulator, partial [Myxococcota bacterium]|nr:sigma 54-interacting transcriptional regulator [Myxococcota bacterium]